MLTGREPCEFVSRVKALLFCVSQSLVYGLLKIGKWLGASEKSKPFDPGWIFRVRPGKHKTGGAVDAQFPGFGHIPANGIGILVRIQAGLELSDIEMNRFRVGIQRIQGILIGHHAIVHFPELTLFSSAVGGFGGLDRKLMHRKRQVQERITDFPGVYVLFGDLGIRLTGVSTAIRSLVVGEFHQYQRGRILAENGVVPEVEFNVADVGCLRTCGL